MGKQNERSTNGKHAGNSGKNSTAVSTARQPSTFINPHFNDMDRKQMETLVPELYNCIIELLGELALEYNISIKFDQNSSKWNAMLLPQSPDNPNTGLILSVRNSDRIRAVFGLYYAHIHKLGGKWQPDGTDLEDEWG